MPDQPGDLPDLERRREDLYRELGAGPGRGLPPRIAERGPPQVRQAELRVRAAGASRAQPAVQPDPIGGRQDGRPAPAVGPGAGQGPAGGRRMGAVPGPGGPGDGGERGDLRGQARLAAGRGRRRRRPSAGKGLRADLQAEASAKIGRLAAAAARSLGCDAGLEAAETVIRAGMLKLGGGMLEQLLAADSGHRGPRVPCGEGHEAEFVAYRDKTFDTMLGPGHYLPRLVPLRGLRARPGAPGRRARRDRAVAVAGAGRDDRPHRGGRAVRQGRRAAAFLPAVSKDALNRMSEEVRSWRIHLRTTTDLAELAWWINSVVSGSG